MSVGKEINRVNYGVWFQASPGGLATPPLHIRGAPHVSQLPPPLSGETLQARWVTCTSAFVRPPETSLGCESPCSLSLPPPRREWSAPLSASPCPPWKGTSLRANETWPGVRVTQVQKQNRLERAQGLSPEPLRSLSLAIPQAFPLGDSVWRCQSYAGPGWTQCHQTLKKGWFPPLFSVLGVRCVWGCGKDLCARITEVWMF